MTAKGRKNTKTTAKTKINGFQSAVITACMKPFNGKEAVEGHYRAQIVTEKSCHFTGSVDVDTHFKTIEPQSHRWDYCIGISFSNDQELVCWVEPHPASSTGEVAKMLAKLAWLKSKLETPAFKQLKAMTYANERRGTPFHWLLTASGECRILASSKEARMLVQQGVRMPTRQVTLP